MLKSLTCKALLAAGLSFISQAHADSTAPSYSQERVYVSDPDLAKQIKSKIGSGVFLKGYDQIDIQVQNGIVTLKGTVKTPQDKETIDKKVRNIEGVKGLDSQITVLDATATDSAQKQFPQDTYSTRADNQLNKKIRDQVSRGWLWNSHQDISLNTDQGVVTLHGTVPNDQEQQKLVHEVLNVEGVKSVRSHLTVQN